MAEMRDVAEAELLGDDFDLCIALAQGAAGGLKPELFQIAMRRGVEVRQEQPLKLALTESAITRQGGGIEWFVQRPCFQKPLGGGHTIIEGMWAAGGDAALLHESCVGFQPVREHE